MLPRCSTSRCCGALLFLALSVVAFAPAARAARPNVLLVSIDSLRRDMLGCYGAALPHAPGISPSPRLDRFATEGVRFADAYTPSPWTLPAHASLFTGLAPMVHAVETDLQVLDPAEATLASVLQGNGYATAGVFSGPYLEPHWGFGRGFERYTAAYGPAVAETSREVASVTERIARATAAGDSALAASLLEEQDDLYERAQTLSHADVSSDRVTDDAVTELDRLASSRKPWFLFVHYFDVHYDYVPPPPFLTRFDPDYRGAVTGAGFFDNPAIAIPDPHLVDGWIRKASARDTEHLVALYAGETAWVDHHLDRVLAKLHELGADGTTLVIVVSDHGDEFFEHGGIGHRRTLFEEVTRVPWLMRLPGTLPAGKVVADRVSLGDVYPTVLDLLDLPTPAPITGRTVVPLVHGMDAGDVHGEISRLVRLFEGSVAIDEKRSLPVKLATVQEAFWYGPIKIVRTRRWPLFPPRLTAEERAMLRTTADEQFRAETLVWIDVTAHRDEPAAAFSRDFSDPRALAALEAFRARYRVLRARRRAIETPPIDEGMRSRLAGLGYATPAEEAPRSPRHGFTLPPPGDTRSRAPR